LQHKLETDRHINAEAGDCGCWVVDSETYGIYGHVVAGQSNAATVYVAPAIKIVKEIEQATGCSVSIPFAQITRNLQADSPGEVEQRGNSSAVANDLGLASDPEQDQSGFEIDHEEGELVRLQALWEQEMKDLSPQRRYTRVAVLLLYWDKVNERYLDTTEEVRAPNE
jgi:hypothetical protein